jgi:phosphate:Na+ symporter
VRRWPRCPASLLDILVGAVLTVLSYSSLAIVLLTATLAGAGMLPPGVALGLVLGANVGSGVLGVLTTARSDIATRRLPINRSSSWWAVGHPLLPQAFVLLQQWVPTVHQQVVVFHRPTIVASCSSAHANRRRMVDKWLPRPRMAPTAPPTPPTCGAEHLHGYQLRGRKPHQADVVETMPRGMCR